MGDVGGDKGQDKHKAPTPLHTAPCPYRKNATFPKNLPLWGHPRTPGRGRGPLIPVAFICCLYLPQAAAAGSGGPDRVLPLYEWISAQLS